MGHNHGTHHSKNPNQNPSGKLDICADLTQLMKIYQKNDRNPGSEFNALHSRLKNVCNESSENLYRLSPDKKALAGRAMKALEAKNFDNATALIAELSE